tara:strand:+ start:1522 stop:2163 length:642 start_codon:yes stop_codon:yes gene_type:complete
MKRFNQAFTILILLLLGAGVSLPGVAEKSPATLSQPQAIALSTMPIAAGHFVQRKYFKVLKQPIKSQGELYFDVNIGLLWQTNKPLYSALLLKPNGLFTENSSGVSQELKGASLLSQVLLDILSGDSDKIAANFSIDNSEDKHCLNLSPQLPQLAKIINIVQLCHIDEQSSNQAQQNDINHIVLHEHSGNRTEIDVQLTPLPVLPEAIRARLQ